MPTHSKQASEQVSLLLVDDDAEFLDILHRRFTRRGLAATACSDSAAAIGAAQRQKFQVAIIDRTLRTGDGLQLLKQLKSVNPQMQVIVLSGHAESWVAAAALAAGACQYLLKPCSFADLEAAVSRTLGPPQPGN